MNNGKLAIVLPTVRFTQTARHCIETVAAMSCEDVEVFIGDNSCNPEKWAFLSKVAARSPHCHVYCHETNRGSDGNWIFLMEQQAHEFICLVSDDDLYGPDYFMAGLEQLKADPACVAASGLLMVQTWMGERLQMELAESNLGATPAARIGAFTGFNTIPFAVHRRAAFARFEAYMKDRPFYPSYLDQILSYAMLAQGTHVVQRDRQVFLYNNTNWSDAETCAASDARSYVAAGLPEQFRHLHLMCWAIDVVHFFNSTYRPPSLSDLEAQRIVQILFGRVFEQNFRAHLTSNLPAVIALLSHAPDALRDLKAMLATPASEPKRLMDLFVSILRVLDAGLAERYAAFFAASFRPMATSEFRLVG